MALRKIDLMHHIFDKVEGHTCKECSNLVEGEYHDRVLRKCKVYGLTHSEASDWRKKFVACGMFNKQWHDKPIIRLVRSNPETVQRIPYEGQMSLEDLPCTRNTK